MNTRTVAALLAICLALSLAAGGTAAQSDPAVGFGDAEVVATQGDVVTVEIQLRNTETGQLRVRAADRSYRGNVDVRDGDDDGVVRVEIDTFRGVDGDEETDVEAAADADAATLVSESTTQEGATFDAGRYNLIAATEGTSIAAVMRLEAPTAGGHATRAVPSGAPFPGPADAGSAGNESDESDESAEDSAENRTTVAVGDEARSRFAVSGLGGILAADPPGDDLVYAEDSTPGAETTHVLQASPNETVEMRSVTIDYGDGPPADVYRLSSDAIGALGVDTTGDGAVDRSARIAVGNVRTSTDGSVTVSFDRPITVSANETLLATYAVQNPDTTGAEDVDVTLNGSTATYTERGVVRYGPAGQGTLGHGVDLRLEPDDDSRQGSHVAPLAALDAAYDAEAGAVVAGANTTRLRPGDYTVRLSVGEAAPEVYPRTTMTETITVTEPSVEFTNQTVPDDPLLTVTADTNLAPGNSVVVRVEAEEIDGSVSQVSNCLTDVDADGGLTCEFDLTNPASDFAIEVSVRRGDDVIGGPVEFN